MRNQHLIQRVYHEPWLITPEAHASIRMLVEDHTNFELPREHADEDVDGMRKAMGAMMNQRRSMDVTDGVATIHVFGTIAQGMSRIERACGNTGLEEISEDLQAANANPAVDWILLDINSPGGAVTGLPELAQEILNSDKLVVAFTKEEAASAAYWLATAASEFYSTESAWTGSIGTYRVWIDRTASLQAQGMQVEVIANTGADLKGMGVPGTSLTESQRDYLQERADTIGEQFQDWVRSRRGEVSADTMRGQCFLGAEAKERNLVDAVVPDLAAARKRGAKLFRAISEG